MGKALRLGAVAALAIFAVADIAFIATAAVIDRPPPPTRLTPARVLQASRPAIGLIQADFAIHTSRPEIGPRAGSEQLLEQRAIALLRTGRYPLTEAGARAAIADAFVADPDAFLGPDGQTLTDEVDLTSSGSGFFYREDGYMITATHVVAPTKDELLADVVDGWTGDSARAEERSYLARTLNDAGIVLTDAQLDKLVDWRLLQIKQTLKIDKVDTSIHVATGDTVSAGDTLTSTGWRAGVLVAEPTLPQSDVAVIRVEVTGKVPALPIATSAPKLGGNAYVVGYPRDVFLGTPSDRDAEVKLTMTTGSVTLTRPMDGFDAYETDAAMNHGNSGGPVLDAQGRVIGIASFLYEPGGSTAPAADFFVPSTAFAPALKQAGPAADAGKLTRTYYNALGLEDHSYYKPALGLLSQLAAASPADRAAKDDMTAAQAQVLAGHDRTPPNLVAYLPAAGVAAGLGALLAIAICVALAWRRKPETASEPVPVPLEPITEELSVPAGLEIQG